MQWWPANLVLWARANNRYKNDKHIKCEVKSTTNCQSHTRQDCKQITRNECRWEKLTRPKLLNLYDHHLREVPTNKCSYKKIHVPTQDFLYRKKCLFPNVDKAPSKKQIFKWVIVIILNYRWFSPPLNLWENHHITVFEIYNSLNIKI